LEIPVRVSLGIGMREVFAVYDGECVSD
jgi:hypothetical protein